MNTLHRLDTHSKIHNYEKKMMNLGNVMLPELKVSRAFKNLNVHFSVP